MREKKKMQNSSKLSSTYMMFQIVIRSFFLRDLLSRTRDNI